MSRSLAAGITALCLPLSALACGSSSGGSGTTAPPHASAKVLRAERAKLLRNMASLLRRTGAARATARCYEEQMSRWPPRRLARLASIKGSALGREMLRIQGEFAQRCKGSPTLAPGASNAQIDRLRHLLEQQIGPIMQSQGANSAQISCMVEQIDALSRSRLRAISRSPTASGRAMHSMAARCRGA